MARQAAVRPIAAAHHYKYFTTSRTPPERMAAVRTYSQAY
jgi:hypothetical protein